MSSNVDIEAQNGHQATTSEAHESMYRVLSYDSLLEEILVKLSLKDLNNCKKVSDLWLKTASKVDLKKRHVLNGILPFRLPKVNNNQPQVISPLLSEPLFNWFMSSDNQLTKESIESVELDLIHKIKSSYADPVLLILTEANNNKVGKKRRWKRAKVINAIRSHLPPSTHVLGIDCHFGALGIIDNGCHGSPLIHSYYFSQTFSVSYLMIPRFNGFSIKIIDRSTEFHPEAEYITEIPTDLRAMIILSSGVGYSGEYLDVPNINYVMKQLNGRIAVAGSQVNDRLEKTLVTTSFADDTANFYFKNGPPPYNPMMNPQKMSLLAILFSGPGIIWSVSTVIQPLIKPPNGPEDGHGDQEPHYNEMSFIKKQLLDFKTESGLTDLLTRDDLNSLEFISFVFFNFQKMIEYQKLYPNQLNPAIILFQEVLGPKVNFPSFGLLTHANYCHDFWPSMATNPRDPSDNIISLPTTSSIASIAIICIKKA